MESVRFPPEDRNGSDGDVADVANIEDKVAKLFERFKRDLEEIFGRSVHRGIVDEVGHPTHRTRAK
jgi:hypothetical protein